MPIGCRLSTTVATVQKAVRLALPQPGFIVGGLLRAAPFGLVVPAFWTDCRRSDRRGPPCLTVLLTRTLAPLSFLAALRAALPPRELLPQSPNDTLVVEFRVSWLFGKIYFPWSEPFLSSYHRPVGSKGPGTVDRL